MEKKLSQKSLLRNLLLTSMDPFCTIEKIHDIQEILEDSTAFEGINHLILVQTYFDSTLYPFSVSKEKAIQQANAAIKDGNKAGYYYLYLLSDKDSDRRNNLNIAVFYNYPEAYLSYAKHLQKGDLYDKDLQKAYTYYQSAAQNGLVDGYMGMLEIDIERNDQEQQKKDYKEALEKGFKLPGTIQ